jgi:hypothetical protein
MDNVQCETGRHFRDKRGLAGAEYLKCNVMNLRETVITRINVRHNMHKCTLKSLLSVN